MFSTTLKTNLNFKVTFILLSANAFNLDWFTILSIGRLNLVFLVMALYSINILYFKPDFYTPALLRMTTPSSMAASRFKYNT